MESRERATFSPAARAGTCSGSGRAGEEGVGDLEAGVGHPGVVGAGHVLRVGGGGDAVVQPADVRDVVAADLDAAQPRDQHRPLLQRVRPHHVFRRRRRHRLLLRGDGARRGARHCRGQNHEDDDQS